MGIINFQATQLENLEFESPLKSCNYHGVSLQFLQPFSIDRAGFLCRDPAIPSPRSFHGVKICSVGSLVPKKPKEVKISILVDPAKEPLLNMDKPTYG